MFMPWTVCVGGIGKHLMYWAREDFECQKHRLIKWFCRSLEGNNVERSLENWNPMMGSLRKKEAIFVIFVYIYVFTKNLCGLMRLGLKGQLPWFKIAVTTEWKPSVLYWYSRNISSVSAHRSQYSYDPRGEEKFSNVNFVYLVFKAWEIQGWRGHGEQVRAGTTQRGWNPCKEALRGQFME